MTYCLQFTQKTLPVVFPKISMCSGGLPLGNQSRRNSKSRNQRWRLLSQEVGVRFTKQDGPSYSYVHTHNRWLSKPAPLGLPPPQSTRKCAHLPLYRGSLQNLNLKKCMHLGEKNKFFKWIQLRKKKYQMNAGRGRIFDGGANSSHYPQTPRTISIQHTSWGANERYSSIIKTRFWL